MHSYGEEGRVVSSRVSKQIIYIGDVIRTLCACRSALYPVGSSKLPLTRDSSTLSNWRWKLYKSVSRSDQAWVKDNLSS